MSQEPKSFIAVTKSGSQVVISFQDTYKETRTRGGVHRLRTGRTLHMPDGTLVKTMANGGYMTADGLELTSTDPNAP